jgi:hypothetical protein
MSGPEPIILELSSILDFASVFDQAALPAPEAAASSAAARSETDARPSTALPSTPLPSVKQRSISKEEGARIRRLLDSGEGALDVVSVHTPPRESADGAATDLQLYSESSGLSQ